jgi:hypothetical protein
MNCPEKIVGVYLRLNGFFLLPQFTLFEFAGHIHVDFLALRPPSMGESIHTPIRNLTFPIDETLFELYRNNIGFEPFANYIGLVVGGESGPGARPIQQSWVVSIRDQCQDARVPFFFKQWGGTNKKKAGRELDGRTWDEMPTSAIMLNLANN